MQAKPAPVSNLTPQERARIRREVSRIFAPLESELLECLNEIRGARGLPQFESLESVRYGAE